MKYGCLIFSLLFFAACQQRDFYAARQFDAACWALQDTFSFTYENAAASTTLQMGLNVDFLEAYAFRNCYLKVISTSPSGVSRDFLVNDTLQDETGIWRVERSGGVYPIAFASPLSLSLEEPGTYRLQVIQYMREDTLCAIEQVGVVWE